jgi:16S rRNA A1518/A1519 N6-dimethyltransferase RsmA/KsgA/DIM1 with predicted DNA glycosylase/AP lyase activity
VHISDISDTYFKQAQVRPEQFFALVRQAFSAKRKTLVNNMKSHPQYSTHNWVAILRSLDIDERIRAEDISLDQWVDIIHAIGLSRERE